MAEVLQVYTKTKSVEKMITTYAAMWEKHGIPGRVAANPVNRKKWEASDDVAKKEPTKPATKCPTDDERAARRKANRTARKAAEEKAEKP